jgi:DNA modification methylase
VTVRIINADVLAGLAELPDESVHCVVTSPPYWGLRNYGVDGQIGLEATPEIFVARMVDVFREVRRVLRKDGTCWVNLGDSYASSGGPGWQGKNGQRADRRFTAPSLKPEASKHGHKPKDLIGIPWRVAFALQADGWWLRSDIIWSKPNPMPESVTDRPTKAHEYVFLLTKSERYFYDAEAIAEPVAPSSVERLMQRAIAAQIGSARVPGKTNGNMKAVGGLEMRNRRTVWTVATQPFSEAHFATFPPELPEICIKAGCPAGGTVLDPFSGAGTTALVADRLQRNAIGIELNPEYAAMSQRRLDRDRGGLLDVMEAAQ